MKDQLFDLFDYDYWANVRWLDRLRAVEAVPARTRDLLAHILAAKRIWILRLRGEDASEVPIWPSLDWEDCADLLDATHEDYRVFLAACSTDDLEAIATYRNSKGVAYETLVQEVLMHVITHGNYHRGQIAQAVRQHGAEPINTDYITYTREL